MLKMEKEGRSLCPIASASMEGTSGDTGEKPQMIPTYCKSGQTSQQDSKDGHDLHPLRLL